MVKVKKGTSADIKGIPAEQARSLEQIAIAEEELLEKFAGKMLVNRHLDRRLVSFQANKATAEHRWCKYKEGFSAALIDYVLDETRLGQGPILDPFAGSGTTLFVAGSRSIKSVGIELLPSSSEIIKVRRGILSADKDKLVVALKQFVKKESWISEGPVVELQHLRITSGAYSAENSFYLGRFLFEAKRKRDPLVRQVLRFSALCVLESISFTRKDGQYLRWDYRSGRRVGKNPFNKGEILEFNHAIAQKINEIASDIVQENELPFLEEPVSPNKESIELIEGSCLEILPTFRSRSFAGIITSPPYCNRYDYTRTYALELAFLGVGEEEIKDLRQTMLTCTVENRVKTDLSSHYSQSIYSSAVKAFEEQGVLGLILKYLDDCKTSGRLNNNSIPRMVRNYFLESALLIFECARVLKKGAPFVMVNDNVRYQGAVVPVDLILSEFAEQAGLEVEKIWVLPRGKGNSSQQMGLHGRQEIRKCVYVWRKR